MMTRAADPITGIGHMLSHAFIQHALVGGTAIALVSGLVGYFVVLRGQVFAADALSHVAFTGAVAALAAGLDLRFGLITATVVVGLALGLLAGRAPAAADDAVTGVVFAWVLGLGVFFLAYFTSHSSTADGAAGTRVLFGSIFGIGPSAARLAVLIAAVVLLALAAIARPLLFASIDPQVAQARGVPVRWLGPAFLALVGLTAAEASQAVGALLLFALLAAPPAAAQRLTDRPWHGLALAAVLSVLALWLGVAASYAWSTLPPSFTIMSVATAQYALAASWTALLGRRSRAG
ncbi:MAG TPA: metal ABC transporter permease [Jatrophihabitans sp.]|nr:metal ABC transporter permease [Jatrophihabitans sp.]